MNDEQLKQMINQFLWTYCADTTTLKQLDAIALQFLRILRPHVKQPPK